MAAVDTVKFIPRGLLQALWTGGFAVLLTGLVSGIWAGLLTMNLKFSPTIPWSAPVMAALLLVLWMFLGGSWGRAQVETYAANF